MAKTRTAALANTPKARAKSTAPTPMAGSKNRYSYQSIDPGAVSELAKLSHGVELDFGNDEKAMRKYRTRLYAINKEYSGKWRFRTIREDSILMIWRLAY